MLCYALVRIVNCIGLDVARHFLWFQPCLSSANEIRNDDAGDCTNVEYWGERRWTIVLPSHVEGVYREPIRRARLAVCAGLIWIGFMYLRISSFLFGRPVRSIQIIHNDTRKTLSVSIFFPENECRVEQYQNSSMSVPILRSIRRRMKVDEPPVLNIKFSPGSRMSVVSSCPLMLLKATREVGLSAQSERMDLVPIWSTIRLP